MAAKRNLRERLGWTGFFAHTDAKGKNQPGKTLWDWLDLLIVPAVLAVGAILFSYLSKVSDVAIAEQRLQAERINAYLAKMEGYILDQKLLSAKDQETSSIILMAQVQTVTALRSMDKERRDLVFQFLRDTELIDFVLTNASIRGIDLSETDLYSANLSNADLWGSNLRKALLYSANLSKAKLEHVKLGKAHLDHANLSDADLWKANLSDTFLNNANLSGANLTGAILSGADLTKANLTKAIVNQEQLDTVKSLSGATMPDGSIHE